MIMMKNQCFCTQDKLHNEMCWLNNTSCVLVFMEMFSDTTGLLPQVFHDKVEELFLCICCQDLVCKPITLTCTHNICKVSWFITNRRISILFLFTVHTLDLEEKLSPNSDVTAFRICPDVL